jgi:hypothetical protein
MNWEIYEIAELPCCPLSRQRHWADHAASERIRLAAGDHWPWPDRAARYQPDSNTAKEAPA